MHTLICQENFALKLQEEQEWRFRRTRKMCLLLLSITVANGDVKKAFIVGKGAVPRAYD